MMNCIKCGNKIPDFLEKGIEKYHLVHMCNFCFYMESGKRQAISIEFMTTGRIKNAQT